MAEDYNTLKERLEAIRDERGLHRNTATRIGGAFLALLDYLRDNVAGKYLSKVYADTAAGLITFSAGLTSNVKSWFKRGIKVGGQESVYGIDEGGVVTSDGVRSSTYDDDLIGGYGYHVYKDSQGNGHVCTDYLDVRKKGRYAEIEIRRLSYINAENIQSEAASKVAVMLPVGIDGEILSGNYTENDIWAYRCLAIDDDGSTATTNSWKAGDQCRCQTFNIKEGTSYHASNRYYWRLVIRTGSGFEYEGKSYYWFEVAAEGGGHEICYNDNTTLYAQLRAEYLEGYPEATDADTHIFSAWEQTQVEENGVTSFQNPNDVPAADDVVVQMGSQTNPERMGFNISRSDGLDTGYYVYAGVNNYVLEGKMLTKLSPRTILFSTRHFRLFSDPNAGDPTPLTRYRGDWQQGYISYYYDEWDFQGSRWLCLYQGAEGITCAPGEMPSNAPQGATVADYWKQISLKGDAGTGYKLLPSPNAIKTKQTGENTYDPATASLTCGYVKNVGGTITSVANATALIDNKYVIYFRRKSRGGDYESKYWFYTDSKARAFLSSLSLSGYDATEFYLAENSLTPFLDVLTRATFLNSLSGVIDNIIVPVVADGSDGTDGTSPIIADLTNEMDSVVCDAGDDTAYGGQVCTTIASMLEGTTRKAFTLVEVKEWNEEDEEYVAVNVSGGTIAGDVTIEWSDNADNSKTVTFTFASAVSINGRREFVIVMRTGNVVREAVFTIAGLRPGADGSPATIYNILPSLDKITFARDANGGLTPSSRLLSFMVRKAVGGNITDILSGQMYSSDKLRLTYSVSEPPSSYNSNQLWPVSSAKEDTDANISFNAYGTATIPNSVAFSSLYLALFKEITNGNSASYTLLDRETIPVIKDGQDGDDGEPGADAWTLTVNPSPIIIEQDIETPSSFGLPINISFIAKCGDNTATVGTIGSGNVSNNLGLTISRVTTGTDYNNGVRLKITAYNKNSQTGKYVTNGYIDCTVPLSYGSGATARSTSMAVRIQVGVNLLGTWTQEIKDGVETSVSENIGHAIDPSGNIETTQQIGTYIRGWAENSAALTETIGARSNGNNLFGFSKGAIFDGSIPFVQGYGMACVWNNNQAYSRVWNLDFGGKTGYYVVTCEIKAQSAANIRFFLADIAPVSGSGLTKVGDELKVAATTQWKKITAVYNLTAVDAANSNGQLVIRDGSTSNNVFIRKLQIEHGSVPSDFGVCKEDEMAASVPVSIDWSVPSAFTKASSGGPDGGECYYNNTHPASGSAIEINAFNISLPYGVYTMSFWAKANVDEYTIQCICGDVNDYDTNVMPDLISGEYGVMESYQESGMNRYGSVNIKLSTQWRKYYIPYYLASAGNMYIVPMRINYGYTGGSSGTFYISKIKFEKGYVTSSNRTEYQTVMKQTAHNIDFSVLVNSLEKAGIHLYTANKATPEVEDEIEEGIIDIVAGKVRFVGPNGNPYASPKVAINPTTGVFETVDARLSGNLYTPYKRLTSSNISSYRLTNFAGETVVNLSSTGLNLQVEVAVELRLPEITADMLGCEVNIFNATTSMLTITGSGNTTSSSSDKYCANLIIPSTASNLGTNGSVGLQKYREAKFKAVYTGYSSIQQYAWLCCFANINP